MHILSRIFTYTIVFSVFIALLKIRRVERSYFPVIIFLCYGLLNEIVSEFSIYYFQNNAPNSNVYVLVSSLIVLYQLNTFSIKKPNILVTILILSLLVFSWLIENFFIYTLWRFNAFNNILFYLVIVFFSIRVLAQDMFTGLSAKSDKVIFLISVIFLLQYLVSLIVELFWIYGIYSSSLFLTNIYWIISWMSLVVNLMYILAVLWIPKKRELSWLSR